MKELYLIQFIKSHPNNWEELLKASPYCIKIHRADGLIIFNYGIDTNFDLPLVRECRGIILEEETFKVVCFPFTKFFNIHETYADKIIWNSAKIETKIDGSIMKLFYYKDKWRLATNGTINAFNTPVAGISTRDMSITFGDLFMEAAEKQHLNFDNLNHDYTYIFEITSPKNRQVIRYNETAIWHIGSRNNLTYKEEELYIGIEQPKRWNFNSIDDVINAAAKFKMEQEGFVVKDEFYHRVKIKSPFYVLKSRETAAEISPRHLVGIYFSDDTSEFLSYFPKYKRHFKAIKKFIRVSIKEMEKEWKKSKKYLSEGKYQYYLKFRNNKYSAFLLKKFDNRKLKAKDSFMNNLKRDRIIAEYLKDKFVNDFNKVFENE